MSLNKLLMHLLPRLQVPLMLLLQTKMAISQIQLGSQLLEAHQLIMELKQTPRLLRPRLTLIPQSPSGTIFWVSLQIKYEIL